MTVFVALIFQVLFVFFAMVINIGLLVHDKINLQNAVDLGAYYGAQRQAEILNEIAHINYQIRQDNKLLAWRYHVLGTLGRDQSPYGNGFTPGSSDPATSYSATAAEFEVPSVCVLNTFWREATTKSGQEENYCYRQYGSAGTIRKIPSLIVVAPFVPGVASGAIQIGALRDQQDEALSNQGPLNWAFAAQMLEAYKMAITARKSVIQKLRKNLVDANIIDQSKQPVALGVQQTIKKNLTLSNLSTFDDQSFGFKNGLATDACAGTRGDGAGTIVEIRTSPLLMYTWSGQLSGNYQIDQAFLSDLSHLGSEIDNYDPQGVLRYFANGEPSDQLDNSTQAGLNGSSLGFEKNPWCMAYVAVHAKTSPRKPFAPFGKPVELEARAFAQPFGGRIGPWYKSQWAPAAEVSSGQRVDPISTPRLLNNATDGGEDFRALLPNYGRFPGDNLGMKSLAAQAATRNFIRGSKGRNNPNQLTYSYFINFDRIPITGDPLAWDNTQNASPNQVSPAVKNLRTAEEIAVSPDLFDATYYSIDLDYPTNYKALNGDGTRLGDLGSQFGNKFVVPPDLGGRNGTDIEGFNVKSQITVTQQGLDQTLRNTLGYFVLSPEHLLTGWAPNTNSDFGFPSQRFGKCTHFADKAVYMIPGVCTNGGRVGYSVRIISRDHLLSNKWAIGGEGQTGAIRNPPATDF